MKQSNVELWRRFQANCHHYPTLGVALDLSRADFPEGYFKQMGPAMNTAFAAMTALERGEIANPDEKRMVGHYWLRNAALAPTAEIRQVITSTISAIKAFTAAVHSGEIRGAAGSFEHVLLIGIGGSALGPQFVSKALARPASDKLRLHFFDNTDPDGMDLVLAELDGKLGRTLTVVVSKSGGTKETRNGMLEAEAAYRAAGLAFAQHAVAVTGEGSELDRYASNNKWLQRFPMWDWVGGRTSETSAVGLLPAALQGVDIDSFLAGARACDDCTRESHLDRNAAAQLALAWYFLGNGRGDRNMVVLPYKDRLELFSKYLQQLIMESVGKEFDLNGKRVHQGLTVFGNKGSTDQHAYIQQLRDGREDFFACFIHVLKERSGEGIIVEADTTSGDFLHGFYLGTRTALYESGRQSITLTIPDVSAYSIGVLIALFERTVGLYANLINVNAYHQPGVEAGKKGAEAVLSVQRQLLVSGQKNVTAAELAKSIGTDDIETIYHLCEHLVANGRLTKSSTSENPFEAKYSLL